MRVAIFLVKTKNSKIEKNITPPPLEALKFNTEKSLIVVSYWEFNLVHFYFRNFSLQPFILKLLTKKNIFCKFGNCY